MVYGVTDPVRSSLFLLIFFPGIFYVESGFWVYNAARNEFNFDSDKTKNHPTRNR